MEASQHCENDALLVDDLLDFSCGDIGGLCEEGDACVVTVRGQDNENRGFQSSSCSEGSVPRTCEKPSEAGELFYTQPDELAELEWLSSFVEESYKGVDQSLPLVSSDQWFSNSSSRKEGSFVSEECRATSWLRVGKSGAFSEILDVGNSPLIAFSEILDVGNSPLIETPNVACSSLLQTRNCSSKWDKRSRSRRSSRSGGRVWTLHTVMPLPQKRSDTCRGFAEQEEEQEEDVYSQASSLDYEPFYEAEQGLRKKVCAWSSEGLRPYEVEEGLRKKVCALSSEGRRCSHCQVQKTPQWRAGPLGPKTLCNACGVRYKSGRLLPEYRPAASPTFITEIHSNSHKKVLEMRTFKSRVGQQEQDQEEFSTCSQESMSSLHQQ